VGGDADNRLCPIFVLTIGYNKRDRGIAYQITLEDE